MSEKQIFEEFFCPICKKPAERGFISGNSSYMTQTWATAFRAMEWFAGTPNALQRLTTLGEEVGEASAVQGPYVKGIRCGNCMKIILDI